jgi:hypothetical protein
MMMIGIVLVVCLFCVTVRAQCIFIYVLLSIFPSLFRLFTTIIF